MLCLVVAATAENYDNSENYDPGTVIVKEMAQAVVIHKLCSSEMCSRFLSRSLTYYAVEKNVLLPKKASRVWEALKSLWEKSEGIACAVEERKLLKEDDIISLGCIAFCKNCHLADDRTACLTYKILE